MNARRLLDHLMESIDPEPEPEFLPPEEVEQIVADLVAKGKLELLHGDPGGDREYSAKIDDPFREATLVVHVRSKPETFRYEGVPYYLETEAFQDKNHYSPVGRDLEDVQLDDLETWIDES